MRKPRMAKITVPKAAMDKTYSGLDWGRTAITHADKSQMATIAIEIQAYLIKRIIPENERNFKKNRGEIIKTCPGATIPRKLSLNS